MKTVVITGATSGIGFAVAKALAAQGANVIGVGRAKERCDSAVNSIIDAMPSANVKYFCGDLSQQTDVSRIADEISEYLKNECGGKLDALINNAGGIRNWYTTTAEGYEMQFALNHLSGFLMTYRMLPYLRKSRGRVILTGSNSHKMMKMHWKDVMYQKHYSCLMAYKQSKLCNMLFAKEFNRRYGQSGVSAYVVDPGLVNTNIGQKQTSGIVSWFWGLRSKHGVTPDVPAQTYVYLCNQMPAPKGLYYYLCKESQYSKRADNAEDANRLFELSEKLCGIKYDGGTQK